MLAFDHRGHFEQMADRLPCAGLSRHGAIANAKALVLDAVLQVADGLAAGRRAELGVFVDEQYGALGMYRTPGFP
jgi:myo-inositol catabolism protein IolC